MESPSTVQTRTEKSNVLFLLSFGIMAIKKPNKVPERGGEPNCSINLHLAVSETAVSTIGSAMSPRSKLVVVSQ